MALGGLRDMSVIETPPPGRHAVQTYVMPFSADVAAAADQGAGNTAQIAELARASLGQRAHVGRDRRVEGGHGVEPQQAQADIAQVDAVEGPVAQARRPQRAPVTHPLVEDAPGVAPAPGALPPRAPDLRVVVGPLFADAEWLEARPDGGRPQSARASQGHRVLPGSLVGLSPSCPPAIPRRPPAGEAAPCQERA